MSIIDYFRVPKNVKPSKSMAPRKIEFSWTKFHWTVFLWSKMRFEFLESFLNTIFFPFLTNEINARVHFHCNVFVYHHKFFSVAYETLMSTVWMDLMVLTMVWEEDHEEINKVGERLKSKNHEERPENYLLGHYGMHTMKLIRWEGLKFAIESTQKMIIL